MLYETIVSRAPVPSCYAAANGLYCLHTARSTCGSDRALRARCMSQAYPSTALRQSPSPKAAYAASGEVFARRRCLVSVAHSVRRYRTLLPVA